jgi:ABC-type polysaccharide/polyol phosphate export permease
MKKYMSRKFIVAVIGLVISLVALVLDNNTVALAGIGLAGCFVIGEAIVDKAGAIKKNIHIDEYHNVPVTVENVSRETSSEVKDGGKK